MTSGFPAKLATGREQLLIVMVPVAVSELKVFEEIKVTEKVPVTLYVTVGFCEVEEDGTPFGNNHNQVFGLPVLVSEKMLGNPAHVLLESTLKPAVMVPIAGLKVMLSTAKDGPEPAASSLFFQSNPILTCELLLAEGGNG